MHANWNMEFGISPLERQLLLAGCSGSGADKWHGIGLLTSPRAISFCWPASPPTTQGFCTKTRVVDISTHNQFLVAGFCPPLLLHDCLFWKRHRQGNLHSNTSAGCVARSASRENWTGCGGMSVFASHAIGHTPPMESCLSCLAATGVVSVLEICEAGVSPSTLLPPAFHTHTDTKNRRGACGYVANVTASVFVDCVLEFTC